MCPSATIIMKGIKNVSHAYNGGNNGSYMDYVYSAGGMLYNAASTVGSTMSGVVYSLFPAEPAASSGTATGTLGQNVIGGYPGNNNSASSTSSRSIPNSSSYGGQRLGGDSPRAGPRYIIIILFYLRFFKACKSKSMEKTRANELIFMCLLEQMEVM